MLITYTSLLNVKAVLIWGIQFTRRFKVRSRTLLFIFIIVAILGSTLTAYAGVEPLATAKTEATTWFQKVTSDPLASDNSSKKGTVLNQI